MSRSQTGVIVLLAFTWIAGCNPTSPLTAPVPVTAEPEPQPETETPSTLEDAMSSSPSKGEVAEAEFVLEDGFHELTLADFATEPSAVDTWKQQGHAIVSSGKPKGYLYSHDSYSNFTWRLEFRYPPSAATASEADFLGNTGFLVYITGAPKIWPLCLEVQGKHTEMASIRPNGGAEAPEVEDDVSARLAARNPIGEWNALEISSRDGALSVQLNGKPVISSQPNFLSAGSIGIQAENYPFEIRRLRIRIDD